MRVALRWVLAVAFAAAGVMHLAVPDKLLLITPGWVPFAREVILVTGVLEIVGAIALLTKRFRAAAGIAFAAYALCVWPANIKQAFEGIAVPPLPDSWWYHGPRLAFQPLIIWAALYAGDIIDWPFRNQHEAFERSPRA